MHFPGTVLLLRDLARADAVWTLYAAIVPVGDNRCQTPDRYRSCSSLCLNHAIPSLSDITLQSVGELQQRHRLHCMSALLQLSLGQIWQGPSSLHRAFRTLAAGVRDRNAFRRCGRSIRRAARIGSASKAQVAPKYCIALWHARSIC